MNAVKTRILLADDDEDDRLFFSDAIEALKIETELVLVSDGEQLIDYLENESNPVPEILFLDLNMPCKNGFECLESIRKNPRLKELTVAIYSTSGYEQDIENAFVGGANVYIRKPNDFEKLKRVLGDVLHMNWQFHNSGLNKDTFLFSI